MHTGEAPERQDPPEFLPNDVIEYLAAPGRPLRILWIDPAGILAYTYALGSPGAVPRPVSLRVLYAAVRERRACLLLPDPWRAASPAAAPSDSQRRRQLKAWDVVRALHLDLPALYFPRERAAMLAACGIQHGVAPASIMRYLRRYWEVIKINQAPPQLQPQTLLDETAISHLETATPRMRVNLGALWKVGAWTVNLRENYFGKSSEQFLSDGSVYYENRIKPKLLTDLEVSYQFSKAWTLSLGVNNLFNDYPDMVNPLVLAEQRANLDNGAVTIYPAFSAIEKVHTGAHRSLPAPSRPVDRART
ncbi:TonB-dependent receptor [Massilia timonae]|uniref:TonB-dependent receptor n=1 Tax=Massilia timonae TaxID=47229 RepID=UPI0028D4CB4B|nr:TonB-dependent receptor [Massilia timonae]